jgi:hypothetical protein
LRPQANLLLFPTLLLYPPGADHPVMEHKGGGGQPRDAGVVAAVKRVLNVVQGIVNERFESLRRIGTCSREFLSFLDTLEERVLREMTAVGFQKLSVSPDRRSDIVLGVFTADNLLVEIGLKDVNRCGILEEVAGGKPPRVYARLYIGGRVAAILEAEEAPATRRVETGYIM